MEKLLQSFGVIINTDGTLSNLPDNERGLDLVNQLEDTYFVTIINNRLEKIEM